MIRRRKNAQKALCLVVFGVFLVFTHFCLVIRRLEQLQKVVRTLSFDSDSLNTNLRASIARTKFNDNLISIIGEKKLKKIAVKLGQQIVLSTKLGKCMDSYPELPMIYVITATFRRPLQVAELTRLSQTLMHVKNLEWLLIEDATEKTWQVAQLLERTCIKYQHFIAPMPEEIKKTEGRGPRGVSNKNLGVQWIRNNTSDGVVYFADDDNVYDIRLFEEMRFTKKVSMWPVGFVGKNGFHSPIIKNGAFQGFYCYRAGGKKFPVDVSSFAVNVQFLLQRPNAKMPWKETFHEEGFLRSLAPFEPEELELKADNCTKEKSETKKMQKFSFEIQYGKMLTSTNNLCAALDLIPSGLSNFQESASIGSRNQERLPDRRAPIKGKPTKSPAAYSLVDFTSVASNSVYSYGLLCKSVLESGEKKTFFSTL